MGSVEVLLNLLTASDVLVSLLLSSNSAPRRLCGSGHLTLAGTCLLAQDVFCLVNGPALEKNVRSQVNCCKGLHVRLGQLAKTVFT